MLSFDRCPVGEVATRRRMAVVVVVVVARASGSLDEEKFVAATED